MRYILMIFTWLTLNFLSSWADPAANLVTSGPYGLLFASFVPFFFDIPVSTRFRVLGVRFSDKSFIYLAGLQVKSYCFFNTSCYSCFDFSSSISLFYCWSCSSFCPRGENPSYQGYAVFLLVPYIVWMYLASARRRSYSKFA